MWHLLVTVSLWNAFWDASSAHKVDSFDTNPKSAVFLPSAGYRSDYYKSIHFTGKDYPFLPIPPPVLHPIAVKPSDAKYLNNKPPCVNEFDYCILNPDYPIVLVQDIISRFYVDTNVLYHLLYGHDPTLLENVTNFNEPRRSGDFVCSSGPKSIRLGFAKTVAGQWLTIVNTDRYKQTSKIEYCKNPNGPCNYVPYCSVSSCKQRYSVDRLLAVDLSRPHLRPTIATFAIPTSCACFVEHQTPAKEL